MTEKERRSEASLALVSSDERYVNRELSWLSFNERVLQEAEDPAVPLYERLTLPRGTQGSRDDREGTSE